MRKDDSGLEEELRYFRDVMPLPEVKEVEEDRWWSPELQGPDTEEKNEEENQYLISLLMGKPEEENNSEEMTQPRDETVASPGNEGRPALEEAPRRGRGGPWKALTAESHLLRRGPGGGSSEKGRR
jgi:hypothetical protein